MSNEFWDVAPVFVIFPVFAIALKWYLEYRTRKQLIEKGQVDEKVKYLYFSSLEMYAPSSLKWGLVLFLVGAALVIIRALPFYVADETILGVMLIAAGAGLLLYYFIANIMKMNHNKKHQHNNIPT